MAERCLACHHEIASRIRDGKGLHASDGYSDCVQCHVEHQGRDFELIYWPDGRDSFRHESIGFPLAGAHSKLECRRCHRRELIDAPSIGDSPKKNLDRSWLGLSPECRGCHEDFHRGQFQDACSSCHGAEAWKPAGLFDHSRAAFALEGRHRETACGKCHPPGDEGEKTGPAYRGIAFASCADCHRDPHEGELGGDCVRCHRASGWKEVSEASFDHDQTKYPLRGRHRKLKCGACHQDGKSRPKHDRCVDCHRDEHRRRPEDAGRWADCENCHGVEGFIPARYDLKTHARTGFPLVGSHMAIACDGCHIKDESGKTLLSPAHDTCGDCHLSPHGKLEPDLAGASACSSCHREEDWSRVEFDHDPTGFSLEHRHAALPCRDCHPRSSKASWPLWASSTKRDCEDCHEDPHESQFLRQDGRRACGRCHVTLDWLAEGFDHDRDSRFPLRGGHERIACSACHRPLSPGHSLEFKGIETRCAACHEKNSSAGEEKP